MNVVDRANAGFETETEYEEELAARVPERMSSDVKDPAQEFAERVMDEWFEFELGRGPRSWPHVQLIFLIARELRGGGWGQK